jgi:hypothetical protein
MRSASFSRLLKGYSLAFAGLFTALMLSSCGGSSSGPVSVTVTAAASSVDPTDTTTLTASVTNDKNSAGVTWTVTGGGALSGTTTTSATYTAPGGPSSPLTVTVNATSVADNTKSASATLTIPVAPSIGTSSLAGGAVGSSYSAQLAAAGGISPYTWTVTNGTLAAGLTLAPSTGLISGTPTAAGAGTSSLTFKVTDSGTPNALAATQVLSLSITAAPAVNITTTSLPNGVLNAAYTGGVVTATGGAGPLTFTLASGTLPAGLTLSALGAITGTPSAAGSFNFSVKAADAFGDSATVNLSITVKFPVLTVTPATLPVGYNGSAYPSTTLAATGGSGTGYTWTLASGSSLPAGLSLSTAGVVTGTPTATATTSFTAMVTDSASNTASGTFSITVKAGVSITTGATLPTAYVGSNYSMTFTATGGTATGFTWTVTTGSTLPAGLTLSSAGVLSGQPTTQGTFGFNLTVTDSASNTASATFSVTVNPAVTITSPTTLPGGYQGAVYPGATLTATGGSGTGYSWTWAAASGSSLPAGLSLSTGGAISGTPTAGGTFSVVVTVKDSANNTAAATDSLTVESKLAVTTASPLQGGSVNTLYSQQLAASGGSGTGYTWTTTGTNNLGTFNLSLSAAGVVSGTPTTTGTATFTAQVTDSQSHTATASFSLTIYAALTVTSTSLPAANDGTAYSQTLTAAGGSGTGYTWTASSSNLSNFSLGLSSAGVVSGTPTIFGTAGFTAKVTDSVGNTAIAPLTIQVYTAVVLPAPNPATLPAGTTGAGYTGSIDASGGSGSYSWTVTGLPADGLSSSTSNGTLNITGTPTSAQTVSFGVSVKDTGTGNTVGPFTYSIVVSNPAALTLPTPNPVTLPSATVNQVYTGSINASGGVGPNFTWTVNSTAIPVNGTAVGISDGISVSNNGSNILTVAGTPTSTGSVPLAVTVKDSATPSNSTSNSYTITVNSSGSTVSGQISLANICGGVTVPPITVSINTSPTQTATTDSNGNYSFSGIPNGNYTLTPSIAGPSSVFLPATQNIVVNNAPVGSRNFSASLGYTVQGTIQYAGTSTGQIYITLTNSTCGGGSGGLGTSIAAPGPFTVRGVPPGTYGVLAWMDISTLANGAENASDPFGTSGATVTVSNANVSGAFDTLIDPTVAVPAYNPGINAITPNDQGVSISYEPVVNSKSIETATAYDVAWSTSPSFSSTSTYTFKAIGRSDNVWILNNGTAGITGTPFTAGQVLYFEARAHNAAGHPSGWTVYGGTTPTPVTIGAATTGNTVTGTVTIPAAITPTGPLYVGFYNNITGNVYGMRIASPTVGANAYSVTVPNGTNYFNFAVLDQNNDGLIDAGDVTNTNNTNSAPPVVISGNLTNQNLTLPTANSTVLAMTQYYQSVSAAGSASGYNLNFVLQPGIKLPVAVTLTSGPNIIDPIDISNYCVGCGNVQFNFYANLGGVVPSVGDTYKFTVTYSDGSQDTGATSVTGALTAFGSTGAMVNASDLATALAPTGNGSSTTPTFTWTDPANAANYIYSFSLYQSNGSTIWQIPGSNSNLSGFSNTITSISWGTDPTGGGSTPSVPSLTVGTQYNWQIQVEDTNYNQAQTQVYYIP